MRLREFKGIGLGFEKKLCTHGVVNAEGLRHMDIDKLAEHTGIAHETLRRWKTQAIEYGFLSDIQGIGPASEQKLFRAGIKDYYMLQQADLEKIVGLTGLGKKKLCRWREEAHLLSGKYIIRARLAETEKRDLQKKSIWFRIKEWLKG